MSHQFAYLASTVVVLACALSLSGCASASSGPLRQHAPAMQPFVTLKEKPAISRDRAIEIAMAEVQRRRPGFVNSAVDAVLSLQDDNQPTWNVSDSPILGGGWTVTVNGETGDVTLCHFFNPPPQ